MRIFILFLCFLTATSVFASSSDSLAIEKLYKDAVRLARKKNPQGAIEKLELAIERAQTAHLPEAYINKRLRGYLANRYSNIGDFDRAIELATVLEAYYTLVGDLDLEIRAINNLGVYNQNIERHKIAYQHFRKGWELIKDSNKIVDKLDLLDGLSSSCIHLNRLEEAKEYLSHAEQLLTICTSEWLEEITLYHWVSKAKYALAIEQDEQAEKILLKSIELGEKNHDRKVADAYRLLAELYLRQNNFIGAYQKANRITTLFQTEKNPNLKDPYLFQSYMLQAQALLHLKRYDEVLINCDKAEGQASFFQRQYMFNESKLFLGSLRRKNFETGVLALYHKYQQTQDKGELEQAIVYADQAKSILLNERWNHVRLLSSDHRKDAIKLRYQLIFQLKELKGQQQESEAIPLRNRLDSLNQLLGVKEENNFDRETLKTFQSNLPPNSLYLEYMIIDSLLFRFEIQNNSLEWKIEPFNHQQAVQDWYNVLNTPSSTHHDFLQASANLPPLLPTYLKESSNVEEINIIPDGVLNYIVFDALPLTSDKSSWKNLQYAVQDYTISYQFSLQSANPINEQGTTGNYIGFAPDYSSKKDWANLKNSKKAMEQTEQFFKGKAYYGSDATKANVQQYSPEANVLHFYAHGVASDSSYSSSYIVMQDEKLTVDELLALPLKAQLAIVTACEVGLGKSYNGEGITGIAWALKAAGTENVIQSMWKLNEQSSSQLMLHFLEHLSKNSNSSKALTQAKREYLKNTEISDRLKHPYYWVGIGHYGSGAKITSSSSSSQWPLYGSLAGLGILIGLGIALRKRNA